MNDYNWSRPFARGLAIIGILIIITGVLAYHEFPPFKQLAFLNCELGYLGLFLFITGFGLHTKQPQSTVNQQPVLKFYCSKEAGASLKSAHVQIAPITNINIPLSRYP